MMWVLGVAAGVVAVAVAVIVYLAVILTRTDQLTNGLGYYGRSAEQRIGFHRSLRRHAALLHPILILLIRLSPFTFSKAAFVGTVTSWSLDLRDASAAPARWEQICSGVVELGATRMYPRTQ